jgi:putative membrane protein
MTSPQVLRHARFDPKVADYWLLSPAVALACSIVLIPVAVLWYLLGRPICAKVLAHMSCTLTTRTLEIRKGWLNRLEMTIPLEKITDLAMFQGPIMRAMGLKGFRVETAGSGGAATGYLASMIGIEDTDAFRAAVLAQRDHLAGRDHDDTPRPTLIPQVAPAHDAELLAAVRSIHAALERIERRLPPP